MNADAVLTLLRTTENSVGQPIAWPAGAPEVSALLIEMAPGEATGWHSHPVPLLGYVLSGEVTVYLADGGRRVVRAGEVSLEGVGLVHNGINESDVPVRMIVFVLGEKDQPFTIPEAGPGDPLPGGA